MSKQTYTGRVCLSREKTLEAWNLEHSGKKTRIAAAAHVNVSEKTLYRMYRRYGLSSPTRKEKKDHV